MFSTAHAGIPAPIAGVVCVLGHCSLCPTVPKAHPTNSDPVHWAMAVGTQRNLNLISNHNLYNQSHDQKLSTNLRKVVHENIVYFPKI